VRVVRVGNRLRGDENVLQRQRPELAGAHAPGGALSASEQEQRQPCGIESTESF
jgi:hypothetical protein